MKNLSNKLSYFAIMFIMGAIIISFALTGFQGLGSNTGEVASVDGTPISAREYNQALQGTIDQYTKMFKAKSLSSKQIKQFGLKKMALQQLISQKHILNFASELNFSSGKLGIKDAIKEYKVFQTGDKFDVTKYKALLKANRLNPAKFEEDIIKQIKTTKLSQLLATTQDSQLFVKDTLRFGNLQMKALAVSFEKEAMTANLKVPSKEISGFLADKKNDSLLNGLYKTYEAEQKANAPKAKVKSLKSVKKLLAKKHLQKSKRKELTLFIDKLSKDIKAALASGNTRKLSSYKKKYKINFEKEFEISPFNMKFQNTELKEEEVLAMFKTKDTKKVLEQSTATTIVMIKAKTFKSAKTDEKALKDAIKFSGQRNSRIFQGAIIAHKQKTSKVVTSPGLFL